VPTIQHAAFSVIWSTSYYDLLATGSGKLVTRRGYAEVYDTLGGDLRLPWDKDARPHWSRFWAHYVAKPERTRKLSSDAAWDRVLPFLWMPNATVAAGPAGTQAKADVLVYPSTIVVIIRVDATGEWPVSGLAAAMAAIRGSATWSLTTPDGASQNRNLDGIAGDLRDRAAPHLSSGPPPQAGAQEVFTVSAPMFGTGDEDSFDLADPTVRSCLVGLAVLGPPGTLREDHLLEENSDPRYGARVYALKTGHAIWNARELIAPSPGDPVGCLLRNQTELVAHISALAGIVNWAAERLGQGGVPVAVQPLVKRAAERLDQLERGNAVKTYRSGIAQTRIKPLRERVDAVITAL
jgi:hypothetical protein